VSELESALEVERSIVPCPAMGVLLTVQSYCSAVEHDSRCDLLIQPKRVGYYKQAKERVASDKEPPITAEDLSLLDKHKQQNIITHQSTYSA
jgi:hypothetical protein